MKKFEVSLSLRAKMIIKLILLSLYVALSNEKRQREDTECSTSRYSYMVTIYYGGGVSFKPICSGTLLSRFWVLTSGGCLTECAIPQMYMVVAGMSSNFMLRGTEAKRSQVRYCYRFPDPARTIDLGLMELETPMELSQLISYVNLATRLDVNQRELKNICAVGVTVGIGRSQPLSCSLSGVLSSEMCKSKWNQTVRAEQFCLSALDEIDICPLDKGGPLICHDIQYGVMTYAHSCSDKTKPVLGARVYVYEEFIHEVITDRNVDVNITKSECCNNNFNTWWISSLLLIFSFFH